MLTKQTDITEAIAHVAAKTARVVVQAMAVANADNSERTQMQDPN